MATDVVMPQMGESIAEGTIVRWIKKVGDPIDKDEPLFEISTDKVDAEIPSPAAGVLAEIRVKEGETVPVNSVVAVIGPAGERAAKAPDTAVAVAPAPEAPARAEPEPAEAAKQPPAAGDGISASTLSVEISNSGSSRSTWSPILRIQRTTVPSVTDSPIWGMTTLTGMV